MGGHARLIAYSCQNVVDGDVVEGSIVDVSDNGVAFMTRRLLRPGDRLSFAGRFFATVVEAEVRVARIAEVAGQLQVGCTFIAIEPAERAKLRAVTAVRRAGRGGVVQHAAAAERRAGRARTGRERIPLAPAVPPQRLDRLETAAERRLDGQVPAGQGADDQRDGDQGG